MSLPLRPTHLEINLDQIRRNIEAIRSKVTPAKVLVMLKANESPISSLEGIDSHLMLQEVYIHGTQVIDLSPLLKLPKLKIVELDESMRPFAESTLMDPQFEIQYSQ